MENKNSNSTLDEININPKTKIAKEKHNLIPINISLVKNIFTLPQQKDKNIIYINDIETLNDSSITNNLEQTSIRYNQNDSLSLSNSNNSSKTKSKNIRVKNINQNNYIKNELIAKEKENILLKKEIFKLREDINLLQNKFSKSKQNEQNLEKNITEIKKDFQIKENLFKKLIEKLKNELKEKDYILNSFQEKIILKNQTIERMRVQLKKKENEINELNRKLKKNLDMNYSILFKNNSKNKIKQKSRANSGRESMNKKLNISKINKSNSKEKIINNNIKTNNILQIQQYHLNTQRENMKNLNYIESSNSQKVIGLKKRSYLFEANTSLINNDKLKYNHDSFSNEGNSRNNEFNNNSLNKFNYSSFNDTSHINKKTKYLESMNSKIKLNILRKRIHINNNSIKNRKKLLNTTIKGIKNIKSQNNNLSQNENCNKSNINSNEINSDINDKKNKTYYKSIPRQKYSLKNFFVEQNYLKIYGKKLKWENKIKLKKNLSIFKIKMKYGQKQKDDNLSKLKDNNGFQTESVSSMDRRYEYIIKPKSLKNFSERNSNTTVKNII